MLDAVIVACPGGKMARWRGKFNRVVLSSPAGDSVGDVYLTPQTYKPAAAQNSHSPLLATELILNSMSL